MRHKLFFFLIPLLVSKFTFAGGIWGNAKVTNLYYKAAGQIVLEFEELSQEKHFMVTFPKGIKKLRFDFKRWPEDSRFNSWWYKLTPWNDIEKKYSSIEFESCINWLIQNYKNGTKFQFGQVGGGKFEIASDAPDEVIVPYLHFEKTTNQKEQVCLIDLG